MRRRVAMAAAGLLGVMAGLVAANPLPPTLPGPVFTHETTFALPFRMDGQRPNGSDVFGPEVAEVRLYVSTDRGTSWRHHATATPSQRRFVFHAGRGGEFWFALSTVDRQGRCDPAKVTKPGLCVVVTPPDPTPPERTPPTGPTNAVPVPLSPDRGPSLTGPSNNPLPTLPSTPTFAAQPPPRGGERKEVSTHLPVTPTAGPPLAVFHQQRNPHPTHAPHSVGVVESPSSNWAIDRPFDPRNAD